MTLRREIWLVFLLAALSALLAWPGGARGAWVCDPSGGPTCFRGVGSVDVLPDGVFWAGGGLLLRGAGGAYDVIEIPSGFSAGTAIDMVADGEGWAGNLRIHAGVAEPVAGVPAFGAIDMLGEPEELSAAAAADEGWAISGAFGSAGIWRYRNGAWEQWLPGAGFSSIDMVSATEGWAATASGDLWHYTEAGGWQFDAHVGFVLNDVDMVANASGELEGWAVGETRDESGAQQQLIVHYENGQWGAQPSPGGGNIWEVAMVSASEGWAIANVADGTRRLLRWDGSSWTVEPLPLEDTRLLLDLAVNDSGQGVAVGASALLSLSGGAWTTVVAPATSGDLYAVDVSSSGVGLAVGSSGAASLGGGVEPFAGPPVTVSALSLLGPGDGFAAGGGKLGSGRSGGGPIWQLTGDTWSAAPIENPTNLAIFDLDMVSDTDGWAVGNPPAAGFPPACFRYDGASWEPFADCGGIAVAAVAADDAWTVGANGVRHWDGAAWTFVPAPGATPATTFQDIDALPGGEVVIVGTNGVIKRRTGGVWQVEAAGLTTQNLHAVAMAPGGEIWAGGNEVLLHFNGTAWEAFELPGRVIFGIALAEDGTGFAVGGGGLVIRLSSGGGGTPLEGLDVGVTVDPDALDLDPIHPPVPGRPWEPKQTTVTVTVTNATGEPVEGVELIGLEHGLNFRSLDGPVPTVFPLEVIEPAPDPAIGELAPGEAAVLEYTVEASNGGRFEISAPVRGAEGARPVGGTGSAELRVITDALLRFEAELEEVLQVPDPTVKAGARWVIYGRVENLSATEIVELRHLGTSLRGNASGMPWLLGEEQPDPSCGQVLSATLLPGDFLAFKMVVATSPIGATRSEVGFAPEATVIGEDGTERTLSAEEILVPEGSSTSFLVHVDTSVPVDDFVWSQLPEHVGEFTEGLVLGYGRLLDGFYGFVRYMAEEITPQALSPFSWPGRISRGLSAYTSYAKQLYEALPEEERERWQLETATDYAQVAALPLAEAKAQIDSAVQAWFGRLVDSYYSGNEGEFARWWGELLGENADAALDVATAGGYAVCKFMSGSRNFARFLRASKEAQALTLVERLSAHGVRGIKIGEWLEDWVLRQYAGWDDLTIRNLKNYSAETKQVVVGRSRDPRSVARIAQGDEVKPPALKHKTVSEWDERYLGFPPDQGARHVVGEPRPWDEVEQLLDADNVPESDRALIRVRWEQRQREWAERLDAEKGGILALDRRGWIDVTFPDADNIPAPLPGPDPRADVRAFRAVPQQFEGRQYYVGQMTPRGVPVDNVPEQAWRHITGDTDLVYVGKADFTPLTPAQQQLAYRNLQHVADSAHGETYTYRNREVAKKLLSKHVCGAPDFEPLFVIFPNRRVRAACFDPNKSWWDPNTEQPFLFFEGADHVPEAPPVNAVDVQFETASRTGLYIIPGSWPARALQDEQGNGPSSVRMRNPGGSLPRAAAGLEGPIESEPSVLRLRPTGLERWQLQTGWQAFHPPDVEVLALLPQTALSAPVEAGATVLPVFGLEELGLDPAENDWFRPGQEIVLDPGGPAQEVLRVASVGSLVVAEPTRRGHEAGELVSVAPEVALTLTTEAARGSTTIALSDDTGLEGRVITIEPGTAIEERNLVVGLDPVRLARPLRFGHATATPVQVERDSMFVSVDRAQVRTGARAHGLRALFAGRLAAAGEAEFACGEDVVVNVGGVFEETVAGTRFRVKRGGSVCLFSGGSRGVLSLALDLARGRFELVLGKRVSLAGLANPMELALQVGDGSGSELLLMEERPGRWTYRR
jgi:hypothetical protein